MTKSRKSSRRGKSGNRSAARGSALGFWGWLRRLACIAIAVFGCWVWYLDIQVREKFEGRKWQLPAQVYSQPLELFGDQWLRAEDLLQELQALEYQSVGRVTRPGQFRRLSSGFEIFTRGFHVGEDREEPAHIRVQLGDHRVKQLLAVGAPRSLVRLEPIRIGGIYPRLQQDRQLVQLRDIPPLLGETIIAVEDQRFVEHWGVSLKGIARAALANIQAGRIVQGGSTLTQQLVKNFYLDSGRRFSRKATEAVMSLLLELHYSKAEILETYINEVYLGQSGPRQIHGFGLAARHYFQKDVKDLSVSEVALMVGLVKGASYYNPWKNPKRALARRNLVIGLMQEQQLISSHQARQAKAQGLGVVPYAQRRLHAYPAFMDLVKRQLLEEYSIEQLSSEGLHIYSTLSLRTQKSAERVLDKRLSGLEKRHDLQQGSLQGATLIAAVGSGEIEAIVGDRNTAFSGFNRALDARRSIGSLVKPAVYLNALRGEYHLASVIDDGPVTVEGPAGQLWRPQNFDRRSHGQVQLYDALLHSYNQATARLGMTLGLAQTARTLRDLGYTREIAQVPSLLLGSIAMSPLDVLGIYHSLANDGVSVPMRSIRTVVNAQGQLLSRYPLSLKSRVDARAVQLLQFAMQGVAREGTARGLYHQLPKNFGVAGKTGTSNDQRDSWFAGFSGRQVGVVWVGRDDNGETPLTGSSGALNIWRDLFMQLPHEGLGVPQAEGLEYLWVDAQSGGLSGENCRNARLLPFADSRRPLVKAACDWLENPLYHWMKKWFS